LSGTMFSAKLHWFEEVESTNTLALEAAKQGASEGTVFAADAQSGGRGRGGHTWHSERGNGLYFSFILRPALSPAQTLWLSLAAGAAVHAAIQHTTGIAADIRWPNDVLIGKRKVCGILAESQADAVVIGIGINVNHAAFPAELAQLATSLRIESGKTWDRALLISEVLRQFEAEYRTLLQEAPKETGASLLARLPAISTWISGKRVHVPERGGYTGITAGLDGDGFLLVNSGDEVRRVLSGGVREIE
ncbi:MAG: biotin--[acetyl-CoA-carboxylase] ligase, partial [Acidobacteriales bacterium]|nr:biotin--[acetyl-CoA-carboxylase] ligase [Terriglobales bacterium]